MGNQGGTFHTSKHTLCLRLYNRRKQQYVVDHRVSYIVNNQHLTDEFIKVWMTAMG